MIGKKLKVNDFKFKYGKEIIYVNVYAAFKSKKNSDKYVIYSYDNKKLYYGSLFIRDKELVIMLSNNINTDIVKNYLDEFMTGDTSKNFENISLADIQSVQIIDEGILDTNVNLNKLYDLTIPKEEVKREIEPKHTKRGKPSISGICFIIFIILIICFFFFNPEIFIGKDQTYKCIKTYNHQSLSAVINENITITFNGRGKIKSINTTNDYVFEEKEYYDKFKNDGLFYKYMNEGDTYKLIDNEMTYRVMTNISDMKNYSLPKTEKDSINYYESNKYKCNKVEE